MMKLNALHSAWQALKNTALKFPAFFAGTVVGAVCGTLSAGAYEIFRGRFSALSAAGHDYDSAEQMALREQESKFSEVTGRLAFCAVWVCAASFFAELLCRTVCSAKGISGKKKVALHAAAQVLCALLAVPIYFVLRAESDWSYFIYGSTVFAFVAAGIYLLHNFQDEHLVVPNATLSLVIEGITVACIIAGLYLVIFAFQKLIFSFTNTIPYIACGFFASLIIGLNILVSYITRPAESIGRSRVFEVIDSCVLLPLYALLLLVLYIYFAKCIFTLSMPVGMINPFVSAATAVYLYFYLSLPREGSFAAAGKFLRKWGALFLFPLIVLQCVAFGIRIREYGFTMPRVASLYYIASSVIFCALPFVKGGKYMKCVYLVLAAAAILMSVPGTGCISVTRCSQRGRIERIYRAHSLYDGKSLVAQNAEALLSDTEKAAVVSAYDALAKFEKKPSWWIPEEADADEAGTEVAETEAAVEMEADGVIDVDMVPNYIPHFKRMFGFGYSTKYADRGKKGEVAYSRAIELSAPNGFALDVTEFSTLYSFYESYWRVDDDDNDGKTRQTVSVPNVVDFDLTEELSEYLAANSTPEEEAKSWNHRKEGTLTLKKDGWTIIFTELELEMDEGAMRFNKFTARGYICR